MILSCFELFLGRTKAPYSQTSREGIVVLQLFSSFLNKYLFSTFAIFIPPTAGLSQV